ncbi:unnamed protein product, partial [Polarella glacialis]
VGYQYQKKRKQFLTNLVVGGWVSCRYEADGSNSMGISGKYYNAKIKGCEGDISKFGSRMLHLEWAASLEVEAEVSSRRIKEVSIFQI